MKTQAALTLLMEQNRVNDLFSFSPASFYSYSFRVGEEDGQPNWFLVGNRKGAMNFSDELILQEPSKRDLVKLRFQERNIYTRA